MIIDLFIFGTAEVTIFTFKNQDYIIICKKSNNNMQILHLQKLICF